MSSFSASDAALDGFHVIRTHWRVVLGWCLFSLLGFVGLVVLGFIVIALATLAASTPAQANLLGAATGSLVFGFGWIAIQLAVVGGLYRLTLRPGSPPNLYYLRLSRDEGRLFGLWLTLLVAFVALMTAGFLALRWLDAISGMAAGIATLAFIAAMAWLAIRLSLAGPANFATGRFGLANSWQLTRGRFWALAGMIVLALCLLLLMFVVVFVVTAVIQAAIGGFHTLVPVDLSDRQTLVERPGAYVFALIAELVIAPIYLVIAQAPFAATYRALAAEPT